MAGGAGSGAPAHDAEKRSVARTRVIPPVRNRFLVDIIPSPFYRQEQLSAHGLNLIIITARVVMNLGTTP